MHTDNIYILSDKAQVQDIVIIVVIYY